LVAHGWRSGANVAAWSVFRHILPKRPKDEADRHHPMVQWQDAPEIINRMRAVDTVAARALEFAALTATRISEAAGARWGEIEGATWTVPKGRMNPRGRGKPREAHVVPLSRQAVELLDGMLKHKVRDVVFPRPDAPVFPRPDGAPVARMQCSRVSAAVTDGKASPHGWRSTFRTWCADHGVDREAAEAALAHKIGGVEGRYNRAAMIGRRRPVMQAWADHLDGHGADTKVVPITGGRLAG
jgi:integrase